MMRLRRSPNDGGAVAIIVTISLVLLFLMVALAIDLGFARADVRDNQTISDFASVAAVNAIRGGGGYVDACHAAVDYAFANAEELAPGSAEHTAARNACSNSDFATLDADGCVDESTTPVTVTTTAAPFTISIMSPVPDDDPTMTVEGQAINEDLDGGPCDRVKVTVQRQRDYIFGPVAGLFSGNPAADAVGVYFEEELPEDIASLIVLEQVACNALTADGTNAGFMVTDRVDADGTRFPGRITVDSNGSAGTGSSDCRTGTRYTINPSTGTICAQGQVGSFALGSGNAGTSHPGAGLADCLPASLGGAGTTGLGVGVFPRTTRYGRSSVDWLVNCQASYPAYSTTGNQRYPFYGDTPACPPPLDSTEPALPPFLDRLHAALQGAALTPADGWTIINSCPPGANLANTPGQTKIHVTCANPSNANSIIFTDVTHVVFNQPVQQQVTNLTIRGTSAGAVVYFRGQGLRRTSNTTTTVLDDVFVYVNGASGLGVDVNNGNVDWRSVRREFVAGSPVMHTGCNILDQPAQPPTAACFAPLALWSNSTAEHAFGGNGVQFISGSYFIPNAHIKLAGGADATFTDAQFYGRTMVAVGGGFVTLTPNPETNIPPPRINFGLIR
ncbi:MAG: Tad domain-containing protein [Nitriliruptorales bacterium]|nr:Tad domain-containing protein [Nitriliruptorales bacterium]